MHGTPGWLPRTTNSWAPRPAIPRQRKAFRSCCAFTTAADSRLDSRLAATEGSPLPSQRPLSPHARRRPTSGRARRGPTSALPRRPLTRCRPVMSLASRRGVIAAHPRPLRGSISPRAASRSDHLQGWRKFQGRAGIGPPCQGQTIRFPIGLDLVQSDNSPGGALTCVLLFL